MRTSKQADVPPRLLTRAGLTSADTGMCAAPSLAASIRDDQLWPLICKNLVELRGFEPLTPSMPWSFVLSAGVSDCG